MDGKISSSSGKAMEISFGIHELSAEQKRKNALKGLGLSWGLMLLTAPLPPIHWLTVPGFFFFGIYSFFRKLREGEFFAASEIPCPECEVRFPLAPQPAQNPLSFVCPSCRYGLKLSW